MLWHFTCKCFSASPPDESISLYIIIPNKTNSNARILTSVCSRSHVQLFATPWTIACQAPLSMGFSRQEYWSGLPFLFQGIFPTQGWNLYLLHRQDSLPLVPPEKPNINQYRAHVEISIFKFSCPRPKCVYSCFLQARIQLKIYDLLHWVMSLKTLVNQ